MASWDEGKSETDEFVRPPSSSTYRIPRPPSTLSIDTEDNVSAQTSDVFRNFIFQSYRQDQIRQEYDNLPAVSELTSISDAPQSPSAEIGRQLARIGDDINVQYAHVFNDMIRELNLTPDTAYEAFEGVARKLLADEMNWGRILILLFFGYRMAMSVLRTHFRQFSAFLSKITRFVVRFIVNSRIAKWIADHGGWRGALSFVPSISSGQLIFISAMACLSVVAVIFLHSK